VVVLDDPAEVAVWGGVGSVVLAGDPLSYLARAIEEAALGRVWISDGVAPLLPEVVAGRPSAALLAPCLSEELTPAEAETLSMLLSGRSNAEISSERGVSVNTVKSCVRAILRKLGCSRREDLFALALGIGLQMDL
jgi:DNA-binding NarL/FixJ family response regulator